MGAKPSGSRFDRARVVGQQQQRERKHHLSHSPDAARHALRAARDAVRHDAYPARRAGRGRRSRARKARERRPRTPRIGAHRVLGTRRNARGASIGLDRVGRHVSVARVDPRRGGRAARRVHRGAVPRGVARPRARTELGSRVHRGALRPRSRPRRAHARFTRSLFFFHAFVFRSSPKTDRRAATPRRVEMFDGTRRASWGLTLNPIPSLDAKTRKRIPGGAPAAARAGFRAARGRRRRRRRRGRASPRRPRRGRRSRGRRGRLVSGRLFAR